MMTAVIGIGAGAALLLYMARRRSRLSRDDD